MQMSFKETPNCGEFNKTHETGRRALSSVLSALELQRTVHGATDVHACFASDVAEFNLMIVNTCPFYK